jgi:pSer/pThr/pTyr-binding forkhead associated (FHA) protein
MLAELERRFPPPWAVELRVDGTPYTLVGATPAFLGRGDAHIKLRHAGISRRHAAIDADDAGFHLRDAGSRNGTLLGGLPIAGSVPLRGSGVIGLGDQCSVQYVVGEASVVLEILDGPDRGQRAVVIRGSWRSPGGAFTVTFREGMAVAASSAPGPVTLNGAVVSEPVVMLVGDTLDAPSGGRLEVRG